MRLRARLFCGPLLLSSFLIGVSGACAQEAQFDAQALDARALDTSVAPKTKGKKAHAQPGAAMAPRAAPQQGGKTPDRQFGELEGWSPGKAPPKPAEKESQSAPARGTGVGVSPSGNMSVGLPF